MRFGALPGCGGKQECHEGRRQDDNCGGMEGGAPFGSLHHTGCEQQPRHRSEDLNRHHDAKARATMRRASTTAGHGAQNRCAQRSAEADANSPGENEMPGRCRARRQRKRYREENQAGEQRRSNAPSHEAMRRKRRRKCRDGNAERDRPDDVGGLPTQILLNRDGQQRGEDTRGRAHKDRKSDGHRGPRHCARLPSDEQGPCGGERCPIRRAAHDSLRRSCRAQGRCRDCGRRSRSASA